MGAAGGRWNGQEGERAFKEGSCLGAKREADENLSAPNTHIYLTPDATRRGVKENASRSGPHNINIPCRSEYGQQNTPQGSSKTYHAT